MDLNVIYNEDCLVGMLRLPDHSVDMILCDLPYGTTACKWDSVIPFELLWSQCKRVTRKNAAIVLTASQPFTTKLIGAKTEAFKYCWIWDKKIPSGMAYARFQPMRQHEDIVVFCLGKTPYFPQMTKRDKTIKAGGMTKGEVNNPGLGAALKKTYGKKNPTTIIAFDKIRNGSIHPTQKPVALFEYLIRTYTNEDEVVLDNCIGSGTTAIACINSNRRYIGFEKDEKYFQVAQDRITSHSRQLSLAVA